MSEPRWFQWPLLVLFIFALDASVALGQVQSGNNVPGEALQIQPGQAVQESISKAGETDYFVFSLDSSGIISLALDGVPGDMKPRITINNEYFGLWSNPQQADKTATNAGDSLTLEKDMLGPASCIITVSDADGKAHTSPYSLKMDFKPAPDTSEPNNLPGEATVVEPNQKVIAYICPGDDVDNYRLDVNTSGLLKLDFSDLPEDMKPRITLGNEYKGLWDRAIIEDKTATNAGDSLTLKRGILGPSCYYIAVIDADRKAHADPYSLTFGFEPAPDQFEPNNDVGDATEIQLDQAVTAYICPEDDKDFYKLYMDSPGVVVLKVDGVPEDMKPYLSIRDKNNRQITDKAATNPGDSLTLEKDLGAGWNYIAVSDADGKAHIEPYALKAIAKADATEIK
jgi:hypothetical protein